MNINDDITQKLNSSFRKKKKHNFYEILSNLTSKSIFTDYTIFEKPKNLNVALIFLVLFGSVLLLISKSFQLQIIEGSTNKEKAVQNTLRRNLIQPYRGAILDRNGKIMAKNTPSFAIELDIARCREGFDDIKQMCKSDISTLRNLLGTSSKMLTDNDILQKIGQGVLSTIIVRDLSKEQILQIETNLNSDFLSQTLLPNRTYTHPEAFAHVLGYVGVGDTIYPSIQGKDGIEKYYDNYLKGIPGEKVYQVDAFGVIQNTVSQKQPISGGDLQLNIDMDLQIFSHDLLKQKVDGKKVFGGVIVAQDPQTGGILTLASYPTFDSQKMSNGLTNAEYADLLSIDNQPFFNRAVSGVYPPGSTFKMVTATAVLSEKIVDTSTTIFDPGYIKVGNFIYRNWKLDGHGNVDIFVALQKSNDTYFYTVVGGHSNIKGLGIKRLHDWALNFGYGKKTGIDLYGESAGFMPDGKGKTWYLGDDFISSIGQGDILSTPLQVNNATTFFANNGSLYEPRIVKDTESKKLKMSKKVTPEIYQVVRKGMLMASEPGGTGYPFFDFEKKYGFKAAGKTGTSEFINKFGEEDTHGWFTVFAPFDKADIAITVFFEGGSAGSDDAAVIARKVIDKWFSINTR